MILTGLVTEYNPFHLGHEYHLKNAKTDTGCDGVICIMSGNFMQRGMPSILDKWHRAKMAVNNGIDLVIELPLVYSISSAENFAFGAISILNKLGIVDNIYFGSEHGDIKDLEKIAYILSNEDDKYKSLLKFELNKGLPYHKARSNAINDYLSSEKAEKILNSSNNILAIEYIKSLIKLNSNIKPLTLKREGASYNDSSIDNKFASATSIRKFIEDGKDLKDLKDFLPSESYKSFCELKKDNYHFTFAEDMFKFLKYKIITEGKSINNILDVKEGIENKIFKEILNANSFDDLILKVKSKRYTYTRISRILTSYYIGLEKYDLEDIIHSETTYIRPLAFNSTGSKILKEIKNKGNVSIITKLPKKIDDPKLELDILGTKAYSILNNSVSPMDDYYKSPIFIK